MNKSAPNGYFADGLIIHGSLESGGRVSKCWLVHTSDRRGASTTQLNSVQEKLRAVLATLSDDMHMQLQWSNSGDYGPAFLRFDADTEQVGHPKIKHLRQRILRRELERRQRRGLRREVLVLCISRSVRAYSGNVRTRPSLEAYYDRLLGQFRTQFDELTATLRCILGTDSTMTPMDDLANFTYYLKFLNPSLADQADADLAAQFNPALTIQENCLNSDGVGLQNIGFYLDGRYHAMLTFKRWPSRTYPGIIHRLTGLPFLDYQITVNLAPLPTKREVDKEEKSVERLRGEYQSSGRRSLLVAIGKKENKIDSLSTGFIRPFAVTYIIRAWDETEAGLQAKCAAVRTAINGMNGAQYYECGMPSTAKKLFFASWPGWTGSTYPHRSLYAEDTYLADLLPFSATFTGHLERAEALFPGSQNNVVGVCTFIGTPPSPQHALITGATGAGKSLFTNALLWQTAHRFLYTMLVEEGLSYDGFTRAMGQRPIIVHPDGDLTINYLDSGGMPLGQLQVATAVALLSRMIGEASDSETQQIRQAMIGRYVQQLYADTFEEWSRRHREEIPSVQRMACATHRWKLEKLGLGSTELEAYADLRDRIAANEDEAQQFVANVREEDITAFLKNPQTERLVMAAAHARYRREDYPVHASLVELMQFARFPEHKKESVDHLATLLSAWGAGGQYGRLFDGPTNISLTENVAHFELGNIPEQAMEMKAAAGLLITGFARQHIISLPRAAWKRIVFEELARFLDVPGGEKIVAESYAQLRKFNCWTVSIVQQYSKFRDSRIRPVVIGNCKQFFLLRQFDRADIDHLAHDIGLPESVCASIQSYPMPEDQPVGKKYASVCYFSPVTNPPLCGTLRNVQLEEEVAHERAAV